MRVGIDTKVLTGPPGGVRRYVEGLLRGLDELARPGLSVERFEPNRPVGTLRWTLAGLRNASGSGIALLHCPFYYPPVAPRCPVTVAIHDVLAIEHPEWFPRSWLSPIRWMMPSGARRAAAVVTCATSTAETISERFGVPRERIRVVPYGVDRTIFSPPPEPAIAEARQRWAGGRPYLLQVGAVEPRRGIDLAVAALAALHTCWPDLVLLVAGPERFAVPELETPPAWVVRTGVVPEPALPALYAGAEAVLSPSRGEGFDFPLLEALACGAAVAASDIPVHVEHFGPAVRLFPSGDPAALADVLDSILSDGEATRSLRKRAAEHAGRFTWKAAAHAHAELWREVVA